MEPQNTSIRSLFGLTTQKADSELRIVNRQLKHKIESLEEDMDSIKFKTDNLERDLQEQKCRADVLDKEKRDLLAEHARIQMENSNLKTEIVLRDSTQEETTQQEASLQRQLKTLEEDVERAKHKLNSEIMKAQAAQTEKESNKRRISKLEEELARMTESYKSAEKQKAFLQGETEKQMAKLHCKNNDYKLDAELTKMRAEELDEQSSALQKEVGELKETNEQLKNENQIQQQENKKLRKENIDVSEQNTFFEKRLFCLKQELSDLKASSNAREKSMLESHKREVERLRERHKAELEEKIKRHMKEKEEMQSQMEVFFKTLNDDKKVERNTVSKAIEQLAKTNTAANQILNAAFNAYKARSHQTTYRQADDVDEVD